MSTTLQFLGACGDVTGSSFLLRTGETNCLIDCGLFQGQRTNQAHNYQPFAFDPKTIDFVVLTHAHLDHCGLIPKLYHLGFRGQIYATPATCDLTKAILANSAQIQEHGVNAEQIDALFSYQDTLNSFKLFTPLKYGTSISVKDIRLQLQDAGHILGSAMVELWTQDRKKLVFTGDLGNSPVPILCDPTVISKADYIICESTYGDRLHDTANIRTKKLIQVINHAIKNKAKVIIPSFALERTQDLLYILNELKNQGKFKNLPVILDSPLASEITAIYKKYAYSFDAEFQKQLKKDSDLFSFKGFRETVTKEESKTLNILEGPAVYIAGSGMADAGRVQHHLLHQLGNPKNQVVFVGFQVLGTLGRKLVDGASRVRILDYNVTVKAQVTVINAFSAHADQKGIHSWLKNFRNQPTVFLVHGENEARQTLANKIQRQLKLPAVLPKLKQTFNL